MVQKSIPESDHRGQQSAPVVSGHTPTPWALGYTERCILREIPGMCDGEDGYAVAITSAHSLLPVSEAKANAAFIVRAVNSHETLVKALDECQRALAMMVQPSIIKATSSMNAWTIAVMAEAAARAALASAREVQP